MPDQQVMGQKRVGATNLAPLRQFFFAHGHVHVPNFPEHQSLFDLCNKLRMSRSQLPHLVVEELDGMGFLWDLHVSKEVRWYYHFAQLRNFYDQYGHTRVPAKKGDYQKLGTWILRQRRDEDILPREFKSLLDQLGFEWAADIKKRRDDKWKGMFAKLKIFFKEHGHSNVSDGYKLDEPLGRWVSTVRYSENKLEDWKMKLLKSVRFKFKDDIVKDKKASRVELFKKLESFYKKEGHANVPETYVDKRLSIFVAYLRQHPQRVSSAEKKLLKGWGFLFSNEIQIQRDLLWLKSFGKLENFKRKFGHCRVPSTYGDHHLARWVAKQRRDDQRNTLPARRKKELLRLGFSFYHDMARLNEKKWMTLYNRLLQFKRNYDTTVVKESFKDKKLAYWVQHQRKQRKTMNKRRKSLLNEIDFVWKVK